MKRHPLILSRLLLLCCLLCACSTPPLSQPPENGAMTSRSDVLIQNGEIVQKDIYTVVYGNPAQIYACKLYQGVEETTRVTYDPQISTADLTYGEFQAMVDAVLTQIRQDNMGMSPTEHGEVDLQLMICSEGDNRSIVDRNIGKSGDWFRYTGYYVYSISQKTLVRGDGQIMGEDAYGMLFVRNYDRYNLTLPAEEMDRSYVLIAD